MNRNFMALRAFFLALAFSLLATPSFAATISIFWEPSPSSDVTGYAVYYGNKTGDYSTRVDAGNQTNFVFQPVAGSYYFFVVTAYTSEGLESLPSDEVAYQPDTNLFQMPSGTFNGLFDLASPQQSLGSFTLKKGNRNSFSGSIKLDGRQYRFSGKPDLSGNISIVIKRLGASPLILTLNVDANEKDHLTGTLTEGSWTMQLMADRAPFNSRTNAAPYVGKYTVAVLGIPGEDLTPGGIGFGSVRVLSNGIVNVRGTLGDGKIFSSSSGLSEDGIWPFYVSAYGRSGGSIGGWLQFETNETESIHGDLSWIKPTLPRNKFYPEGFSNSVALIGSAYQPPDTSTNPVLRFVNGTISVSGADLSTAFAKDVIVSSNKIVPAVVGEDALTFRIAKNSGLFSGRIRLPDSKVPIRLRGSVLQNQNVGYGLFSRTNLIGEVRLEPSL